MNKRRIIQPNLWTEQPIGAIMGASSFWPFACLCALWIIHNMGGYECQTWLGIPPNFFEILYEWGKGQTGGGGNL